MLAFVELVYLRAGIVNVLAEVERQLVELVNLFYTGEGLDVVEVLPKDLQLLDEIFLLGLKFLPENFFSGLDV